MSVLALTFVGLSQAKAEPQGGTVTAGGATISQSGATTTIQQTTDRAIIHWNSFNIASPESVTFQQPNSGSITVNKINGPGASQIDGSLVANGNIVLINPNGILFGKDSHVDIGGLVASTSDLEDDNAFINGGPVRFSAPGRHDARIENHGTITARDAGLVGLVAPEVENHGIIRARMGKVQLASGDIHTIDFAGDGLIQIEASPALVQQRIKNTGTIEADGGEILITAAQARDAIDALVTNSGQLRAQSIGSSKGKITLSTKGLGDVNDIGQGTIEHRGIIDTLGLDSGEVGGDVDILSDRIGLFENSFLTASGHSGGGDIRIGGDYQGIGLPTAQQIYIDGLARVQANATDIGNGGTIIYWSDNSTRYFGDTQATGGMNGGDGGLIEVSSKNFLDFSGTVDLTASLGDFGLLLLDPTDITISNAASSSVSASSPYQPTANDATSNLNITTLQTALASGAVTVQTIAGGSQPGNITVIDPISWAANQTLTLNAHNNIIVNGSITGRNVTFTAGNDVVLNADITPSTSGQGTVTFQQKTANSTIGVGTASGTMNISSTDLSHLVGSWGNVTVGSSTNTGTITVDAITLPQHTTIQNNGTINVNGNISMATGKNLILSSGVLGLNANLSGTGTVTLRPAADATTVGIGDASTGTYKLTDAALNRIQDGWTTLIFGRTGATALTQVAARTWSDNVTINTAGGELRIIGTQTMGSNNLTLSSNNLNIQSDLYGSGNLTIQQQSGVAMGVGTGAAGTLHLSDAEIDYIQNGWNLLSFGNAGQDRNIEVASNTWNDNVRFQTKNGTINILGDQEMGTNNLTFRLDNDVILNGNLTGQGNLWMYTTSTGTSIGLAGGAGTLSMSSAELDQITDGWSSIKFGNETVASSGAITANSYTWRDDVELATRTGIIQIDGAQNLGANDLTLTSRGVLNFGAALAGTGSLIFKPEGSNRSISIGSGATEMQIGTDDLDNIADGWNEIVFGRSDGTGGINFNSAYTWKDNVRALSNTGAITIAGSAAQNFGANNFTIETNGNPGISSALTGTGVLTIKQQAVGTGIGLAGATTGTTVNLTSAEMDLFTNGWDKIVFGREDATGNIRLNTYSNWRDDIEFLSGSGGVNFTAAQNFADNDVLISTNNNLTVGGNLTSSGGDLTIRTTDIAGTVGLGDASALGNLSLDATEISRLTGWDTITVGRSDGTAGLNIGTAAWNDKVHLITAGELNLSGNLTTSETTGTTFVLASTAGNFVNTAGASAINPNTGRFLVYSSNPASDTLGGIDRPTKRYNKTYAGYGPDSVTETGNVFLYSVAPILNVTINDTNREYGDANPSFGYNIDSGLIDGDTLGAAVDSATLSTAATQASDTGTYSITGLFDLTELGYQLGTVDNGTLTIDKATLTATAQNVSREYGVTNPGLTVVYSGFKNSDDSTAINTLATTSTSASITSDVGSYTITASGALDNNYNFLYTDGSLDITQAALTLTVDDADRLEGVSNPNFTYTLSGLRNGDLANVLSGVNVTTAATMVSPAGSYLINATGGTATNYYVATYTPGTLTVTAPPVSPLSISTIPIPGSAMVEGNNPYDQVLDLSIASPSNTSTGTLNWSSFLGSNTYIQPSMPPNQQNSLISSEPIVVTSLEQLQQIDLSKNNQLIYVVKADIEDEENQ